ncbi:hypothetical protein OOK36_56855 [Streptomyces sp. NBC_00365]|uniref:hypothetical protein n=1 Tax=Streptomyces sp. NBC_00365 TaxID=2975726 RepID=UPI0022535EC4|nr:hypothetical protein [Streptomyces sp. NBC_00365]MCX5097906.1 hypothetical protein [Streptomyces sp. NBC_00365]
MELTPNTAEVIDAPPPPEAYANAPDLRREMHRVLALGAERAWLLRRAALMDRMALYGPGPGPVGAAAQTAGQHVLHDRSTPAAAPTSARSTWCPSRWRSIGGTAGAGSRSAGGHACERTSRWCPGREPAHAPGMRREGTQSAPARSGTVCAR